MRNQVGRYHLSGSIRAGDRPKQPMASATGLQGIKQDKTVDQNRSTTLICSTPIPFSTRVAWSIFA